MDQLQLIPKNRMAYIDIHDDVDLGVLYKKLLDKASTGGTVYVLDGTRLIGIITQGDIRRYFRKQKDSYINKNFTSFLENEIDNISEFLQTKTSIHSVPVVDKDMNLKCEYVRVDTNVMDLRSETYYFFDFLYQYGIREILCFSKDCTDWMKGVLKESKAEYLTCNHIKIEDVAIRVHEKALIIYEDHELDFLLEAIRGKPIGAIMLWEKFDNLMSFPWVKNWHNIMEAWCENIARYTKSISIIANRTSAFSKKMRTCLEKEGMSVILLNPEDTVIANHWILVLEIGRVLTDIPQERNNKILYIEDCIYERLCMDRMYKVLIAELIPAWERGGVHVVALEEPASKSLIPPIERSCLSVPDAYELGKTEELELVFGDDVSGILQGEELVFLTRGTVRERIENHPISQELPAVFLFGPCIIFGTYVKAKDTISSVLQNKIGDTMCVRNLGTCFWGKMLDQMRGISYKKGDIVVFFKYKDYLNDENINIPVVNVESAYGADWQGNVWDNVLHCNSNIMKNIADILYLHLKKWNMLLFKSDSLAKKEKAFKIGTNKEIDLFDLWLKRIDEEYSNTNPIVEKRNGKIGAIVMNCNPFSLGHKYLIQVASSQVEKLFVFVVSENKSTFDFSVRYKMVKDGTEEFKNVIVLPSGPCIISNDTMNGYFIKDTLQEVQPIEQYKTDLRIFGAVIAPRFGINVRFVGEEPVDLYTQSYNLAMKTILPEYNIRVIEIPRMSIEGKVISASKIREFLNEGEFEKVYNLVPATTFKYLIDNEVE